MPYTASDAPEDTAGGQQADVPSPFERTYRGILGALYEEPLFLGKD